MVGWRGMVGFRAHGKECLHRMIFKNLRRFFFTTSQAGQTGPDVGQGTSELIDAFDIDTLMDMDIVVTCQGGFLHRSRASQTGRAGVGRVLD